MYGPKGEGGRERGREEGRKGGREGEREGGRTREYFNSIILW